MTNNFTSGNKSIPKLIRKSELSNEYINKYRELVESPIKLNLLSDLKAMTEAWTEEENFLERRLVNFNIEQTGANEFSFSFAPIPKTQYTPNIPIISCIFWQELNIHIVTSVDIVLLLEFLIQQSFSIEEKNRIRRNLQSLKTYTISRHNKSNERFFQLIMKMEDPRPRNIEKDLKVFEWNDLFRALHKVVSKYSPNVHSFDAKFRNQAQICIENGSDTTENYGNNHSEKPRSPSLQNSSGFLPYERQKDLKRKLSSQNSIKSNKTWKKGKKLKENDRYADTIPESRSSSAPLSNSNSEKVSVNTNNNVSKSDEASSSESSSSSTPLSSSCNSRSSVFSNYPSSDNSRSSSTVPPIDAKPKFSAINEGKPVNQDSKKATPMLPNSIFNNDPVTNLTNNAFTNSSTNMKMNLTSNALQSNNSSTSNYNSCITDNILKKPSPNQKQLHTHGAGFNSIIKPISHQHTFPSMVALPSLPSILPTHFPFPTANTHSANRTMPDCGRGPYSNLNSLPIPSHSGNPAPYKLPSFSPNNGK